MTLRYPHRLNIIVTERGPIVSNLCKTVQSILCGNLDNNTSCIKLRLKYAIYIESFRGGKLVNDISPVVTPKDHKQKQFFLDFLSFSKDKPESQSKISATVPSVTTLDPTPLDPVPEGTNIFDTKMDSSFDISPQTAVSSNLSNLSTSVTTRSGLFSNAVPKLRFTSCIKPPLRPSAHRERIMWYMNRTEEVVEDFRIEQVK